MTYLLTRPSKPLEHSKVTVRFATSQDAAQIFDFICKKAEFERDLGAFSGELQLSQEMLTKTLFGKDRFAYVLMAEQDGGAVGYILYYFRYASFLGIPSIWIDDLYVDERFRKNGIGSTLMESIAQIARDSHCRMLAWSTDSRNERALQFYYKLGAQLIDQKNYECMMRLYL